MAKPAKKKSTKAAPRKKLTSERALKLRPHDHEPPEEKPESQEPAEEETKRKPKQARLPGTEDPEIEELEATAESYAGVRDERQALTTKEVDLKQELLGMMQKYGKEKYLHNGIEIRVVHKDTTVKVKIKKDE